MVSNNLLEFAAKKYGFNKEKLHFISESTNQVYCFEKDGKSYALRFSVCPPEGIHGLNAKERISNIEQGIFFTDCTIDQSLFSNGILMGENL